MRVIKIVCHNGQEFFCRTQDEFNALMKNFREHKEEEIKRDYPDAQFIVHHFENVDMTEEEYYAIPATMDGALYFNGIGL